jgi:hypothetical protein
VILAAAAGLAVVVLLAGLAHWVLGLFDEARR